MSMNMGEIWLMELKDNLPKSLGEVRESLDKMRESNEQLSEAQGKLQKGTFCLSVVIAVATIFYLATTIWLGWIGCEANKIAKEANQIQRTILDDKTRGVK